AVMGPSQPLGAAAARIASAVGDDLADVRIHTGPEAARFAADQGAVAVATGRDIAFASGAYQPGTPAGDALLAHDVAHVAQQSGGSSPAPEQLAEDDANQAAMSAVAATHGGALDRFPAKARTGFGLSLNRCSGFDDSALAFTPLSGKAAEAKLAELGGTMR